jgi:hypothetical protein
MKDIPAFPTAQYADGVRPSGFDNGMTLRDYFAAKAMQADLTGYDGANWPRVATQAYQLADAMMKARTDGL